MPMIVRYSEPALRDIKKIPRDAAARILDRVEAYAAGMPSDIKKLAGNDKYRMRVGDYRLIFSRDGDSVLILRIVHRKDAY